MCFLLYQIDWQKRVNRKRGEEELHNKWGDICVYCAEWWVTCFFRFCPFHSLLLLLLVPIFFLFAVFSLFLFYEQTVKNKLVLLFLFRMGGDGGNDADDDDDKIAHFCYAFVPFSVNISRRASYRVTAQYW